MAFLPQLCETEKKQGLSTYATKAELLDYNTKQALSTHTNTMENSIDTKLLGYTTKEALSTHTNTVESYIDNKLLEYTTKRKSNNKLGFYVKKTDGGDIDAQNHKVINLSDPTSDSHAVSLRYLNTRMCKPIICITAEVVGAIPAHTACFTFGAGGINAGRGGVVLPTNGRIVYMTASSINANGGASAGEDISFGIIGDGFVGIEPRLHVSIPKNAIKGTKTITVEHTVLEGGVLNFYCLNNSQYNHVTIVSAFVELDI